ncbi:TPA: HEPN domain-containing protein [bacterium]|jgi:HEPN domain-containing protein|nr:HEPN domain-containing protein [bacterium]
MFERYAPEDPKEWINRAYSSLNMAKKDPNDVYLEDLCYNAQQAVEKAIKAVFIKYEIDFPFTHDIAELLSILQRKIYEFPEYVKQSINHTKFAVLTRYPGIAPPIKQKDYEEAIIIAEKVVNWAESIVCSQEL